MDGIGAAVAMTDAAVTGRRSLIRGGVAALLLLQTKIWPRETSLR